LRSTSSGPPIAFSSWTALPNRIAREASFPNRLDRYEYDGFEWLGYAPSGIRRVLNDVISIYFADATLANAFVARWCVGSNVEGGEGVFRVHEDEPNR